MPEGAAVAERFATVAFELPDAALVLAGLMPLPLPLPLPRPTPGTKPGVSIAVSVGLANLMVGCGMPVATPFAGLMPLPLPLPRPRAEARFDVSAQPIPLL